MIYTNQDLSVIFGSDTANLPPVVQVVQPRTVATDGALEQDRS
ncbi:hypothetical protein [Spirosoma telluris]